MSDLDRIIAGVSDAVLYSADGLTWPSIADGWIWFDTSDGGATYEAEGGEWVRIFDGLGVS